MLFIYYKRKPIIICMIANIFSHSVGWLFIFLKEFFKVYKFLILIKSSLSIFSLIACAVGAIPKQTLLNPRQQRFFPMFSSKSFIIINLTFRTMIHFNQFSCVLWNKGPALFFLMQISSFPFVENAILFPWSCLATFFANELNMRVKVNLWTPDSIPLI